MQKLIFYAGESYFFGVSKSYGAGKLNIGQVKAGGFFQIRTIE